MMIDTRTLKKRISDKIKELLASARFWALVAALATIAGGYAAGTLPQEEALKLVLGALLSFAGLKTAEDMSRARR